MRNHVDFSKFLAEIQSFLTLREIDSAQANTARSFASTNFSLQASLIEKIKFKKIYI